MRLLVIGSSGAGKSTFARAVAARLGAPHIELDALNWDPGWTDLSRSDPLAFADRVRTAIRPPAWTCDGNYSVVRPIVLARASHLVWLDYARAVVMSRVIRRSFRRAVTHQELWPGTGNREEFRRWLEKDHPIRWAWDTYRRRKAEFSALLDDPSAAHLAKHRIRRPSEAGPLMERLVAEALSI